MKTVLNVAKTAGINIEAGLVQGPLCWSDDSGDSGQACRNTDINQKDGLGDRSSQCVLRHLICAKEHVYAHRTQTEQCLLEGADSCMSV